jgi:acyl-CoA thioesterase FadM
MRKEAWRFDTHAYDFHFDIAPRYTDLDTWRHVNNAAAHQMHLEGRIRHQVHLMGPDAWHADDVHLRPRRVTTHFLRVTHYPDTVRCGVTLRGVQADGYLLSVALFQRDACVGLQECVMGA